MAGLIDAGYVARPEEDVFATTGAHLDVRVLKDGKYINPETIRSLLTRLKIGKERKPLWQQQGSTWKPAAPITSGFGPRVAPTAFTFSPNAAKRPPLSSALSLRPVNALCASASPFFREATSACISTRIGGISAIFTPSSF